MCAGLAAQYHSIAIELANLPRQARRQGRATDASISQAARCEAELRGAVDGTRPLWQAA